MLKNQKIKVETDTLPVCPYCEKQLNEIEVASSMGWQRPISIYMCSFCKKVLSIGGVYG